MKYKIGDKFVRDSDVASFDKLEIAYIWPEMDRYVLYIEDDGWRSEPYVVRDEGTLSSYYKEVEAFFEVGKTYKFKADGGAGIRHFTTSYTVRSVHEVGGKLNAVAVRVGHSGMDLDLTILRDAHFKVMEEIVE